jgi:hypothetical protein
MKHALYLIFFICFVCLGNSVPAARQAAFFAPKPVASGGGGGDDLTGIALRYKADDVTGSDGDAVSAWADSGGGGHDLAQAVGGKQPIVKVSAVNGHRAVQFDGVQDALPVTISPTLMGTATATAIFVVLKQDSTQAANVVLSWEGSDFVRLYCPFSDNNFYFQYPDGSGGSISGSKPAGFSDAWHVLECHRNGANGSILVDGVSVVSSSSVTGSLSQSGSGIFSIGESGNNVRIKGQVAEVRIYNQDKDSTSSTNIRAALKATYGTP